MRNNPSALPLLKAAAPATALPTPGISFTVEQLEAMLQAAKAQQAMAGVA